MLPENMSSTTDTDWESKKLQLSWISHFVYFKSGKQAALIHNASRAGRKDPPWQYEQTPHGQR